MFKRNPTATCPLCFSRRKQKALLQYKERHPTKLPGWSQLHFLQLQQCIGVLNPIATATELIQGAKYPTASLYFPALCAVQTSLLPQTQIWLPQETGEDKPCGQDALTSEAKELRANLSSEYVGYMSELTSDVRELLIAAAQFDPKFKDLGWLPGHSNDDKDERAVAARKKVNANLVALCLKVYKQMFEAPPDTSDLKDLPISPAKQKTDVFFSRFSACSSSRKDPAPAEPAEEKTTWTEFHTALRNECYAYLLSSSGDSGLAPLKWWKSVGVKDLPKLALPARYFLSIPASQASTERLFSLGGKRDLQSCGNMDPDRLSRLVASQMNLPTVLDFRHRQKAVVDVD